MTAAARQSNPECRASTKEEDETWHTGSFHTRLRAAIDARGLGLTRIRDHLAEHGVQLSTSTLSNWQRGVSRPASKAALGALAALEKVLDLQTCALSQFFAEPPAVGRWHQLGPGVSPREIRILRNRLDAPEDGDLTVISATDDVAVADGGVRQYRSRIVVQAERTGVDRHIVIFHTNGTTLPRMWTTADCALGRTAVNPDAGLIAAELRFAPLVLGETCPIEYLIHGPTEDLYFGRWIRTPSMRFELTVRFGPRAPVCSARRIWRIDARSQYKDVCEIRLIGGRIAHMIESDPSPGFHGIRWE